MASSTPKQGYNIIFYYTSYPLAIHSKTLYPHTIHSKIPSSPQWVYPYIPSSPQWVSLTHTLCGSLNLLSLGPPVGNHHCPSSHTLYVAASTSWVYITFTQCGSLNLVSLHHIYSMWQPQPSECTLHSTQCGNQNSCLIIIIIKLILSFTKPFRLLNILAYHYQYQYPNQIH